MIVVGKKENNTFQSLKGLSDDIEVIVSTKHGLGIARNYGASQCHNSLMVQLDDDLHVDSRLLQWVQTLKQGQFAMGTVDGSNPATRVFAIYLSDFIRVGCFNNRIRYIYEDLDFFERAIRQGLEFKFVPSHLYTHIPHSVDRYKGRNRYKIAWECSRGWVKYPSLARGVFKRKNIFSSYFIFFIQPLRNLDFSYFLVRFYGVLYWLTYSVITPITSHFDNPDLPKE